MQIISDIMTPDVASVSPSDTVRRAAELMEELNVGSVPVCDGEKLVGIVTDRDITIRATSAGKAPDEVTVEDIMSREIQFCFENQMVDEVLEQMGDLQIRRLPVLDHSTQQLIGIVSLGDMAAKHSAGIDHTLANISTPAEPDRSQTSGQSSSS